MKTQISIKNREKINISATFIKFTNNAFDSDKAFDYHPQFEITIKHRGQKQVFNFYGSIQDYRNNKQKLDDQELLYTLYCRLSDGLCYQYNKEFVDFCKEFGYERIEQYHQAMNSYNGCQNADYECTNMFGKDYYLIADYLQETYNF